MKSFSRLDVAFKNSLIADLGIITVGVEVMRQFYGSNFLAKLDFCAETLLGATHVDG